MDYTALRELMVKEQLISRGIKDTRVLDAFYKVERQKFIPEETRSSAYGDFPLPIGNGQTISQPYMAALMTEYLGLTGQEKILEIGTGSGYQTAILAELAKEVCSIERINTLAKKAQETLNILGYTNVKIKTGDGSMGWEEEAPFDRIIIAAAAARLPLPLAEQLKDNGKIILPVGETLSQILTIIEKKGDKLEYRELCGCVFVPLIGKYGLQKEAS